MEDLAERILRDIKLNFIKEPNIDEFDIIPVFNSKNKCPVIIEGTKIALEAWCVKIVWLYCYQKLIDWKENRNKFGDEEITQYSEMALLINPDISMVWNLRKVLLFNKITVDEDFRLCKLVLTRKPKSSEVFMHRRWLLKRILEDDKLVPSKKIEKLFADEMLLCSIAASKYPNNYCAWSHREWVHENVTSLNLKILWDDLKWNESYVQLHVSDYSCLHFRQYLLKHISTQLHQQSSHSATESTHLCVHWTIYDLLRNEWILMNDLMENYYGHEALWYHRRFVIHCIYTNNLMEIDTNMCLSSPCDYPQSKKTRKETSMTNNSIQLTSNVINLEDELQFIWQISDKGPLQLINNHKRWMAYLFKLNFQSD